MKNGLICAATALCLSAAPSFAADTALGLGLTWVFGNQGNQGPAASLKLFSDRDADTTALSAGVDYHFGTASVRPNIGVGYIGQSGYVDANFGYNTGIGMIDFGMGAGFVNTKD